MPLVIICGYPCSGKTTFAIRLREYLLEQEGVRSVVLVNEESENQSRREGYKNSASEKNTRGLLKSAVDHALSGDCVVICDSLNYIKGFRYELHCMARTLRTPHCTVWVQCEEAVALERSLLRQSEEGGDAYAFPDEVYTDLQRRFETPNDKNRWDAPLFLVDMSGSEVGSSEAPSSVAAELLPHTTTAVAAAVAPPAPPSSWRAAAAQPTGSLSSFRRKAPASDPSSVSAEDGTVAGAGAVTSTGAGAGAKASAAGVSGAAGGTSGALSFSGTLQARPLLRGQVPGKDLFARIAAHLAAQVTLQPNSSTVSAPRGSAEVLYELDAVSQRIAALIVTHQQDGASEGTPLVLTHYGRTLGLHRHVSPAELQRHRRQFVSLHSKRPTAAVNSSAADSERLIGAAFIDFLGSVI